jgi:sigma-B regulation protein RsbU (phosphoserine phosphatase)
MSQPAPADSGEVVRLARNVVDLNEERRSRQELAEALAFRDRVLGILGHDLRNPLTAITALATSTMGREDLPSGVRERLSQVDLAAKRSLTIIETLLDFSESRFKGALHARRVPTDLVELASGVIDELRATHPDGVITLGTEGRGPVDLDPGRIEQLLTNLIGNALTHGVRGQPVRVSVDVREAEAVLAVNNRGPLIPATLVPALFEPFTQGTSPAHDGPRGLGLGLYIVQQIVTAHAGQVAVDSTVHAGTTFTVRLPRQQVG